jgi:hypothetical protein
MADWFETRFREPVASSPLDPAFVARVRALVVAEWHADPSTNPSTATDDPEGELIMLETDDRTAGQATGKPRLTPGRWLLVAAAALVVALVGALLVAAGGEDDPVDTVNAPTTSAVATAPAQDVLAVPGSGSGFPALVPGAYFIDPDGDDTTPLRVTYEIADEGWSAWIGAVDFVAPGPTMLSITTVTNLVTDGCLDHTPLEPPVGPTVDDLATALAQLAPFEVTQPPTDVTLFGYEGQHLELTVPAGGLTGCVDHELHSWISTNNGGAFAGYDGAGQTEEFWILDVEGTRLVLVAFDSPTSTEEVVAERDAIFDSIRIEP